MPPKVAYNKELTSINLKDSSGNPFINDIRFKYAILEKIDKIVFKRFENGLNLDEWDKGKLFGEAIELKWVRRKDRFHAVVITDDQLPDGFKVYSELQHLDEKGNEIFKYIYLWGEKDESVNGWFEPRIPRILKYPVDDFKTAPSRLKIKIKEYTLSEEYEVFKNGNIKNEPLTSIIHRFVDIV